MKSALRQNTSVERQDNSDSFASVFREGFPDLNFVHEIEIRGSCGWQTLSQIMLCFARVGAEPVSVHARRYKDHADVVTCWVRYIEDRLLETMLAGVRGLPGVNAVLLSHHLGRASGASYPR